MSVRRPKSRWTNSVEAGQRTKSVSKTSELQTRAKIMAYSGPPDCSPDYDRNQQGTGQTEVFVARDEGTPFGFGYPTELMFILPVLMWLINAPHQQLRPYKEERYRVACTGNCSQVYVICDLKRAQSITKQFRWCSFVYGEDLNTVRPKVFYHSICVQVLIVWIQTTKLIYGVQWSRAAITILCSEVDVVM